MAQKQLGEEDPLHKRMRFRLPSSTQSTNRRAEKKRRSVYSNVVPVERIAVVIALAVLASYGSRGMQYIRSFGVRDDVEDWPSPAVLLEKAAAIASREADASGQMGECHLPRYPATGRVPSRGEFEEQFWRGSRTACIAVRLGTGPWKSRELVRSRRAIEAAVTGREWSLRYMHGNEAVMHESEHLFAVFSPSGTENAPWAEITVPMEHDVLPHYLPPVHPTRPWRLLVVPAASGHAPVIAASSFYLVVLAGRVRVITYRTAHAFTISDTHAYDWHVTSLPRVRASGNQGRSCVVNTDEALIVPSGFGYAFLALENAALLQIDIESGY